MTIRPKRFNTTLEHTFGPKSEGVFVYCEAYLYGATRGSKLFVADVSPVTASRVKRCCIVLMGGMLNDGDTPMKYAILALCALSLSGCFRQAPVIMYRDGWGGTNVAVPSPFQPVPYAASMPAQNGDNKYPDTLFSGWYLGRDNQWRAQRWVKLGTDINGNPSYMAVYP